MGGDDYQHLLCQSVDYQVGKCRMKQPVDRVELVVQLSGAACIENMTWGYDWDEWLGDHVLWVLDGCSGVFRFVESAATGGGQPPVVGPIDPIDNGGDDDGGDDSDDGVLIFDLD